MTKTRGWLILAFSGVLITIFFAWRFQDNIYAYVWRLLHDPNVMVGQKQFRMPEGAFVWTDNSPKRVTIFSLSDRSNHVVITLHGSDDNNAALIKLVERDLCARVKCEVGHNVLNVQGHEVQTTTIHHRLIVDQPMVKVFYLSVPNKALVEFDGNEDALRRHQQTINDLLEQAVPRNGEK